MHHLLIDTNVWVDLLINSDEEMNLKRIERWKRERLIQLLVPAKLKEEWQRQKERCLSEIKAQHKKVKTGIHSRTREMLDQELKQFQLKIERIDAILNEGKFIRHSNKVHKIVGNRYDRGLPPFHINRNSHGDAYIYFSSVEYLTAQQLKELILITRNKNEFGDPSQNTKALHQGLQPENLTVHYYYSEDIGQTFHVVGKFIGDKEPNDSKDDFDFTSIYELDTKIKEMDIEEQVIQCLRRYQDQLPFIPTNMLVRMEPFKIKKAKVNYTYHSSFRINTNNVKLAEYFKSIQLTKEGKIVSEGKTKRQLSRIREILSHLDNNLIHEIGAIQEDLDSEIILKEKIKQTSQFSFNQLDFVRAFKNLNDFNGKNDRERLQHAYLQFQFGNFQSAIKLLSVVHDRATQKGKHLTAFIALYNMKKLKNFIEAYYSRIDDDVITVFKKIDGISIRNYQINYVNESPFIQDVIKWIAESNFYYDGLLNMSEVIEEIRDHYYTQINGGYSNNSNYQKLVSAFAEIEQFLEQNCIIFNGYRNYEELVDKLMEGLMMIYSFNVKQIPHLTHIYEYFLFRIILYSNRESIVKHYKRLHLYGLQHAEDDQDHSSLEKIALKFLKDYYPLKELMQQNGEQGSYYFRERNHKVISNLLLILTLTKRSLNFSKIAKALLPILKDDDFLKRIDEKSIGDFFREKGKYMRDDIINDLLNLALEEPKLHRYSIVHALRMQIERHHQKIRVQDADSVEKIKRHFVALCPKCKTFHHQDLLAEVFFILSSGQQGNLRAEIGQMLERNFNGELYYTLAMNSIIEYKPFLNGFIKTCPPLKKLATPNFFSHGEAQYPRLNEVINLAYKFELDLSAEEFIVHNGLSNYYDWLLDLEGFDYENFNPLWVLEYKTSVYFRKIFLSKKASKAIKQYLVRTPHPEISKLYIEYTSNES